MKKLQHFAQYGHFESYSVILPARIALITATVINRKYLSMLISHTKLFL
jgi:hypothetical protein